MIAAHKLIKNQFHFKRYSRIKRINHIFYMYTVNISQTDDIMLHYTGRLRTENTSGCASEIISFTGWN